jgi:hypothetical protein
LNLITKIYKNTNRFEVVTFLIGQGY